MGLYKLFSCNVEIQYKSYFLSKAMIFTLLTTILNVIIPFIVAYRSRGFWLKSYNFYEQPAVRFTYEYLLVAETGDPREPIVCDFKSNSDFINYEENCGEIEVQEHDYNKDGKNDKLKFKFYLNIPPHRAISSLIIMLALDFQLKTVCPLHMQSLAVINKEFSLPSSGLKYYGDIQFYQITHLPCLRNHIDNKYNISLFNHPKERSKNQNIIDAISDYYFSRKVTTYVKTIYLRNQHSHTGIAEIEVNLRVPEMEVLYTPSLLQELKWAWPQYLSLVVVFNWVFNKIKRFVFNHRLLMAWEIIPWKRN